MNPGVYSMRITNNKLKSPIKRYNIIGIEFIKLPEIHKLIPTEVPTST